MINLFILFLILVLIYFISYHTFVFCFCKKKKEKRNVVFDDNITVMLFDKEDTIDETKNKNKIYKILSF